ncbi:TetR family transcriptional regulator [Aminobacter aminovorans]|jgi:AcrR family transcriptional regulator|uniref:Rut operon repressor n=1 Tax=Aminobacter aminovorans TaxID=83263 RepID=A0A380WKB6_AMIAI|nr:TetR/AcrR family transcriptional regulator [Aminobacter aminovorans]TCS28750.1 TetR family transcriptional regulator [Aminobacter aminovorans]SUU88604.1 Rut operon repressor [Aminobacter aminovorans]
MRKVDPEKFEARKQQILDAAIICFTRKGFHGTSTAEICAEAGMSPGNLFHYFPTKQAIIAAIVEQDRRETAAYFAQIDQSLDLFDEILKFMDIVLELAADPAYSSLALEIAAEAMRDKHIAALVSAHDAEMQAALSVMLRNAALRGQIDPALDPVETARWIGALIDGVFGRIAVDPGFHPLEQKKSLHLLLTRYLRPIELPASAAALDRFTRA